ncbi:MAG: SDR family oxidoreductase [Verrucomicrobia bacterium]|nr:SDR family oxidoreductase [Verrucomicrobiota bacterium]
MLGENQNPISGKSYVVFGASGGIGSQLTAELAHQGAHVVAAGRNGDRLRSLSDSSSGVRSSVISIDDPDSIQNAIDLARTEFGQVDGIANCIGGLILKPAHQTSLDEWNHQISVNLTSCFLILKASIESLRSSRGSLVFISSVAAGRGFANHEAVAASKAGVEGLILSAAATYASAGIRVNGVAPGLVDTPLSSFIVSNEGMRKASQAMHPLNRIGTPKDISSAIRWLLHPDQSWVSGQIIGVDGGMSNLFSRNRA